MKVECRDSGCRFRVSFRVGGGESDEQRLRFGVRELSYELTLLDGAGALRRVEYDPAKTPGEHVVNVGHGGMVESAEGRVASFIDGKESSATSHRSRARGGASLSKCRSRLAA